jgi:hypothetical protein
MGKIIQKCKITGKDFEIDDKDQAYYEKMDVPLPTLCPDERQRRRLSWRNEINLYKDKSALSGKDIISIYSPDKPFKVYDHREWYGDKWDALEYGRDFDFNKTFLEQFEDLWNVVPKINLIVVGDNENSEFTHDNYKLKNCYLVFDGEQAQDCSYGETFGMVKDCMDFMYLMNSQFCYECVNCNDCHNLKYSSFSNNCSDSAFLVDCKGCRNCFGCCNLQQKEYHIGNKPYSKEEYEEKIKAFNMKSYKAMEKLKQDSYKHFQTFPKKATRGLMNENVTGDNVHQSKDSYDSYDCLGLRDCRYCSNVVMAAQDCYDVDIWGDRLRKAYDCECTGADAEDIIASYYAGLGGSNIFHSTFCMKNVHNILGCDGLIQKKYCILNKQYSKEDYEALLPKIIAHMQKTGEWGEFFPSKMSAFGYNETVANDYFPMTKEDATARGYKWKEKDPKEYLPQNYEVPDNIDDVHDEIENEILACVECGRNYKITPAELKFYRRHGLPVPRKCFNCRHADRQNLRNGRHLWRRNCDQCGIDIRTSYAPERPEKVFCEKCYLKEIA